VPLVDLHVHSTASDGDHEPHEVVRRAAAANLSAIALTDHDTLDGIPAARVAAAAYPLRIVTGCEFSVAVVWGEMHLLGYFLPASDEGLNHFLRAERGKRRERAQAMVEKLNALGVGLAMEHVLEQSTGNAVGRPHVARALVSQAAVSGFQEAFDRYLASGRPAFVPKDLPTLEEVTALVHRLGGVSSAAHLRSRGTRSTLKSLKAGGVDAVEVRHPGHDVPTTSRLESLARDLDLLCTGGSDWHGDSTVRSDRSTLGALGVPAAWLEDLERLHLERVRSAPI
jgi:predicted metal-dependent phosphoesterase TrpH